MLFIFHHEISSCHWSFDYCSAFTWDVVLVSALMVCTWGELVAEVVVEVFELLTSTPSTDLLACCSANLWSALSCLFFSEARKILNASSDPPISDWSFELIMLGRWCFDKDLSETRWEATWITLDRLADLESSSQRIAGGEENFRTETHWTCQVVILPTYLWASSN